MTDHLYAALVNTPWLGWVLVFASVYALGMALGLNQHARDLAADVRRAMARVDQSVDFTARCAMVPPNKFSNQSRAVAPFTFLWRLFAADEIVASEWEVEFCTLRLQRRGLTVVRADVGALLRKLDEALTGHQFPMVKADLVREKERAS